MPNVAGTSDNRENSLPAAPLRVLLVGAGGRDHALGHALSSSPLLGELHAAPGNAGLATLGTCHFDVDPYDSAAVAARAVAIGADLVVIGAEDVLVAGLADAITAEGIPVFGPSRRAARLEGSKVFSKQLMDDLGIATAEWTSCSTPAEALAAVDAFGGGAAIKAEGLAAGCGAFVCHDIDAARAAIDALMVERIFGDAGSTVIVERLISGEEVSVMALTDGTNVVPLPSARDYKRLGDDDAGPNTGGMGAHAPSTELSEADAAELARTFIQPVVTALAERGAPFRGVIYAGIMLTADGPMALEYNCRFGNPETQALVRVIDADLLALMWDAAAGSLANVPAVRPRGAAVAVCVATENYPELQLELAPVELAGVAAANTVAGVEAFLGFAEAVAGEDDRYLAAGGRAVTISAWAETAEIARARAYEAAAHIELANARMRTDIGTSAIVPAAVR